MHLPQAQEQKAAAFPRGDLGCGGYVAVPTAAYPRVPHESLAPARTHRRRRVRPRPAVSGRRRRRATEERTLIDWLVLVKCTDTLVGRDECIYKDCANFKTLKKSASALHFVCIR